MTLNNSVFGEDFATTGHLLSVHEDSINFRVGNLSAWLLSGIEVFQLFQDNSVSLLSSSVTVTIKISN